MGTCATAGSAEGGAEAIGGGGEALSGTGTPGDGADAGLAASFGMLREHTAGQLWDPPEVPSLVCCAASSS